MTDSEARNAAYFLAANQTGKCQLHSAVLSVYSSVYVTNNGTGLHLCRAVLLKDQSNLAMLPEKPGAQFLRGSGA